MQEIECRLLVRCVAQNDCALQDGRIGADRNGDKSASLLHGFGDGECFRNQGTVGVAGLTELRGLRDVFRKHKLRLQRGFQAERLNRGHGGSSVGCVDRIGDSDAMHRGAGQRLHGEAVMEQTVTRPQDERSMRVGDGRGLVSEIGGDNFLRERKVGGEEYIVGRAVQNLRGQCRGRGVRNFDLGAGRFFKIVDQGRKHRLQVRGGGNAQRFCLRGGKQRGQQDGTHENRSAKRSRHGPPSLPWP